MSRWFLHIPRTGGMTRRYLYGGHPDVVCCGHNVRLSAVPEWATPIVYLREPVSRFASAYDHLREGWVHDIEGPTILDIWPTVESLALDIEVAWPKMNEQTHIFRRATDWLDCDREYVALRTEDMVGPRINATVQHSPALTKAARQRVLDWYADDLVLWDNIDA